jgi:threonine/homoserine/homoserine lactone efflux protein
MPDLPPILSAWITGWASGFLGSVPVGPINITILHEGVRRGFGWAVLIGLGAVVMESIYCTIGFASFSGLFDSRLVRATMELISFMLVFYLGIKYVRVESLPPTPVTVKKIEKRLHPHTAFMTGFVRVLGNPSVLLLWITLAATFISHEWVGENWPSKSACIIGMATGAMSWFVLLSFAVSRGYGKLSDKTLVRLSQISGGLLLVFALVIGARLVTLLAHQ